MAIIRYKFIFLWNQKQRHKIVPTLLKVLKYAYLIDKGV